MKRVRFLLSVTTLMVISALSAFAQTVDFRQAANNDRPFALGDVHWIYSILQTTNSAYHEGMSVPQRLVCTNIAGTQGNLHTLTFDHQSSRDTKHAYDYLTSYSQALAASAAIAPGALVTLNPCGGELGPPNTLPALCASLHGGAYAYAVDVPDAMGVLAGHSVAASAAQYEARFGNRTIMLYANAPVTNAVLAFNGYTGGQNTYAAYTLTWTSTASSILIEMAGHLAMGSDVSGAGTGIGYGAGNGAASISGAPFHFRMTQLDGHPLGSQDNQIMGSTVIAAGSCGLTVVATPSQILCAGSTCTVSVSAAGGTPPYSGTGSFNRAAGTYTFTVTDSRSCSGTTTVTLADPPQLAATSVASAPCNGGNGTVNVSAHGGTPPYNGTGSYNRPPGTYTFSVTDAVGCSSSSTVTVPSAGQIVVTASAPPIPCNASTTTVTVTAAGGTGPYTGTGTFSRGTGTWNFLVSDANGCSATASLVISASPGIAVSAVSAPGFCSTDPSTVTVTATGGTAPYTGTGTFTRTPGTYTFVVTDANGCSGQAVVVVTAPPPLVAAETHTPVGCGGSSSTVTITATGGTPPYYGTGTFTRTPGTYVFTVTDAHACRSDVTVTIASLPALAVTASATPLLCGSGVSTVTVTATGGTPPYTGTGTFMRGPGTYTFSVTDAASCSGSASVTITAPPPIAVNVSATPILCHGDSSDVTITATGGVPPYSGTGTRRLTGGVHIIIVTDANGCSAADTVALNEPPVLAATITATPILCNGSGNSTVTITATGGTPPYYGTGTFSRPAGTYTFTVTDAHACTRQVSITITEPPQLTASASATPILCHGGTSTVTVTGGGGTPPYTGTGTFMRGPGTYTFTVTDANGCTANTSVTITEPPALSAAAAASPILCNGGISTVTVTATGGTPPYTGTGTFTRGAGTYTFIVTDAHGCPASASVVISEPQRIQIAESHTPILCHGGGPSIVTITATGGTAPLTGGGTFDRGPGTYVFVVQDANGCRDSVTVTITEPPQLTASATATPILCHGSTSTVTVTATGGTPPYTGTGTFTRGAGTYTFTVTDANGCTANTSVTITEPPALAVSANATPILCNGGTSTVTVTATGGTAPYTGTGTFTRVAGTYIFTVTDAHGCPATVTVMITEPPRIQIVESHTPILCHGGGPSVVTITAFGGTAPLTGGGTFDRGPGTYVFVVQDANGCRDSVTVTITEPPQLTASATATPILCHGGTSTVTVTATGGTPPYTGTGVFTRGPGTYTFTVTDANGCTANTSVTITEPPALAVSANATPILCNGGTSTVTVTATGGTAPYTGTGTFTRTAGTYTFIVTDAHGCTANVTVTISAPPQIAAAATATPILCNGGLSVVTVTAAGGTAPYTGTGTFTRGAGTYTFTVTDANGCAASASVTITEPPRLVATVTATPILCHGGTSTVTVTAVGGTVPYNGTGTFTRGAGSYTFAVTDANGCKDSVSITITEPPLLAVTVSATPILCHDDLSTVVITATGGTPPYLGTGTFSYGPGTYTFLVNDAHGCPATATVTITAPPELTVTASAPPVNCATDSSTVTVTASGGTPAYIGTGTFRRGAGTHSFTVTDANGCQKTVQVTVASPPLLVAYASATPILCNGKMTTVTVIASGGVPPYTGTGTFMRFAGTHTFTVTDSNGCTATTTITVTQPAPLNVACSLNNTCVNGQKVVTVTASGGTPPYTYDWNVSPVNAPVIYVPCGYIGKVTVVVHDSNWSPNDSNSSCAATCTVTIVDFTSNDSLQYSVMRIADGSTGTADDRIGTAHAAQDGGIASPAPASKRAPDASAGAYELFANYPNPFNPTTTIRYHLPEASRVRLYVVNMYGQTISVLVDGEVSDGTHVVTWNALAPDGGPLPSGSYLYRLQARALTTQREFVKERVMMLLK